MAWVNLGKTRYPYDQVPKRVWSNYRANLSKTPANKRDHNVRSKAFRDAWK